MTTHGCVAAVEESSGSDRVAAGIAGVPHCFGMAAAGIVVDSGRVAAAGIAYDFEAAVGIAHRLDSVALGRSSRHVAAAAVVEVASGNHRTAGTLVVQFRVLPFGSLGRVQVADCHSCPRNWDCTMD